MIIVDGREYQNESDVPDFGSIECVSTEGQKREYQGLAADLGKLPTYCGGGSTFLCVDTGEVYVFHEKSKNWMKI